jgi:hypothetical protein
MMNTQKIIALGFSYYDGHKSLDELSEDQRKHAIRQGIMLVEEALFDSSKTIFVFFNFFRQPPSPLEFCGYFFNFQTILVGPLSFFKDYKEFISGENLKSPVSVFFT